MKTIHCRWNLIQLTELYQQLSNQYPTLEPHAETWDLWVKPNKKPSEIFEVAIGTILVQNTNWRNVKIIDGTTNPGYNADIGIQNGRIQRIGYLGGEKAAQIIDVEGLVVSPGFIDTHSHSDLMLLVEPKATQKIMQGITTEVLGQDGISVAPHPVTISQSWRKQLSGLLGNPSIECIVFIRLIKL